MSARSLNWASEVWALFTKELMVELRSRYSLNTLLMFAFTTLVVVSFFLGDLRLQSEVVAALYWITIFFSSMSGLAGVFVREEEAKTAETLRMFAKPSVVYSGKLLYNLVLLTLLAILITPLYIIFMNIGVTAVTPLVLVISLGVIGLSGATTIIGAIVAKSAVRGALFAVLSFPVLLPLLIVVTKATTAVLSGSPLSAITAELQLLVAYLLVMVTLSYLLFEYVWND